MICVDLVEGCDDCAAEGAYLATQNHVCSELCALFVEIRRVDEEFHRLTHEPVRCESCNHVLRDNRGFDVIEQRPCRTGCCRVWFCPRCKAEWASDGPVDCPTCGSVGKVLHRARMRKIHSSYRRRRRYS